MARHGMLISQTPVQFSQQQASTILIGINLPLFREDQRTVFCTNFSLIRRYAPPFLRFRAMLQDNRKCAVMEGTFKKIIHSAIQKSCAELINELYQQHVISSTCLSNA
jgi:hypothetical protein